MSMTPVKNGGVAIPAVAAAMLYKTQRSTDRAVRREEKARTPEPDSTTAGKDGGAASGPAVKGAKGD